LVQHRAAQQQVKELPMFGKITAALAVALVLSSAGFASARPMFDGVTYPHSNEQYCYMPSSPCDNEHRMTN
jgi:hypothetical protein